MIDMNCKQWMSFWCVGGGMVMAMNWSSKFNFQVNIFILQWNCRIRTYRTISAAHAKSDDRVLENIQADFQNSDLTLPLTDHTIIRSVISPCKTVITGNKTEIDSIISGTYYHPDLIPHIACWFQQILPVVIFLKCLKKQVANLCLQK